MENAPTLSVSQIEKWERQASKRLRSRVKWERHLLYHFARLRSRFDSFLLYNQWKDCTIDGDGSEAFLLCSLNEDHGHTVEGWN